MVLEMREWRRWERDDFPHHSGQPRKDVVSSFKAASNVVATLVGIWTEHARGTRLPQGF